MIAYKKGSASAGTGTEPRTPQQDIEAWFAAKPDRAADWAGEYSVAATNWAKTDLAKDKYGLQGEYILAWAKDHPEVIDEWKKANPTKTDEPKPEDLVAQLLRQLREGSSGEVAGRRRGRAAGQDQGEADRAGVVGLGDRRELLRHVAPRPGERAKVADLEPVPADMVTASGAGLDPHITLRNALSVYQLDRVAAKRTPPGGDVEKIGKDIEELAQKQSFTPLSGLVGEPLVNVLELNVELDPKWPVPPTAVVEAPGLLRRRRKYRPFPRKRRPRLLS